MRGQPRTGWADVATMRAAIRVYGSSAARRVLSLLVCALCSVGLAYPLVFLAIGAAVVAWQLRLERKRKARGGAPEKADSGHKAMRILWGILFGMYVVLYLSNAMAPEASPDGAGYHLGLVARYLREHGFVRITDNMYAAMPGGVEMLFLFAFAFGRHSAAALVHFAFLVALAWQIFSYGRRSGFPLPARAPHSSFLPVRWSASTARAPITTWRWRRSRSPCLPAADLGCRPHLAPGGSDRSGRGLCFAAKYTAWPAVVYAVGFVLRKTARPRFRSPFAPR